MTQIEQFSQEYIEKNTPKKDMLFKSFLDSQEPYTSIFKNNPWLAPPNFKKPLSKKKVHYWNTTVGRKHPYWKTKKLVGNGRSLRFYNRDSVHQMSQDNDLFLFHFAGGLDFADK